MANDQTTSGPESMWTISDTAQFFRCTIRHVHNLMSAGLPHFYLGRVLRFDPYEVRSYLKSNRRIAATQSRRSVRIMSV